MQAGLRYSLAIATLLVIVGAYGLLESPGVHGFALTDCIPKGDCTSHLAPGVYSAMTLLIEFGTALGAGVQARIQRYRA